MSGNEKTENLELANSSEQTTEELEIQTIDEEVKIENAGDVIEDTKKETVDKQETYNQDNKTEQNSDVENEVGTVDLTPKKESKAPGDLRRIIKSQNEEIEKLKAQIQSIKPLEKQTETVIELKQPNFDEYIEKCNDLNEATTQYTKDLEEYTKAKIVKEKEIEIQKEKEKIKAEQYLAKMTDLANKYEAEFKEEGELSHIDELEKQLIEDTILKTLGKDKVLLAMQKLKKPGLVSVALTQPANSVKLKELESIDDQIDFAIAITEFERNLKMVNKQAKKPVVSADSTISGAGSSFNKNELSLKEAREKGDAQALYAAKKAAMQK